jgi:hypothetical protein
MILFISKKKYETIQQSVQELADNQKKLANAGSTIAENSLWHYFATAFGFAFLVWLFLRTRNIL